MTQANYGDTVKVHYTAKLDDGTVFDSSIQRDPLEFTIGQGQIIPGFEQAVVGMQAGELKTASVPSESAYGPYRDEMVIEVDLAFFPTNVNPEVGQQLQIHQADGQSIIVTVTDVSDTSATLDANHPLAGKDLTFDIELVSVE